MAAMETPYSVCAAVLAHVEQAFVDCGWAIWTPETPRGIRSSVSVGGIVVDDCCEGLLIVAPERVYRTIEPFPTEAGADEVCRDGELAVDVLVFMARCIPVIDDRGRAPSLTQQQQTYAEVLRDAAIVWRAVVDDDLLGDDSYGGTLWERANVVQTYTEPLGGCVGSETRLALGLPYPSWCPPCGDV